MLLVLLDVVLCGGVVCVLCVLLGLFLAPQIIQREKKYYSDRLQKRTDKNPDLRKIIRTRHLHICFVWESGVGKNEKNKTRTKVVVAPNYIDDFFLLYGFFIYFCYRGQKTACEDLRGKIVVSVDCCLFLSCLLFLL